MFKWSANVKNFILCILFRKHRTEVDIQNLQLSHSKLKATIEQNERSIRQQQEKERQLVNKNKLLLSRLKMEKEEVSSVRNSDCSYGPGPPDFKRGHCILIVSGP